jgi:type IV pilus assembly protein PilA
MVTVAIIGVLAAISVPNFLKLLARSKQAEAKTNLRALYELEQAHQMEFAIFTTSVLRLAFNPERGNRYEYLLQNSGTLDDRTSTTASTLTTATGIMVDVFRYGTQATTSIPAQSACDVAFVSPGPVGAQFTALAIGNIDDDPTYDIWSISSQSRLQLGCDVSANVAAGEPANDVNDVNG